MILISMGCCYMVLLMFRTKYGCFIRRLSPVGLRPVRGTAHLKRTTDVLQHHQCARPDVPIDVELMIALKRFDCF